MLWALVLAASLAVTGDRMLRADSRAIVGRDEAHIWAAKAKVLYVARGINDELHELLAVRPDPPPDVAGDTYEASIAAILNQS